MEFRSHLLMCYDEMQQMSNVWREIEHCPSLEALGYTPVHLNRRKHLLPKLISQPTRIQAAGNKPKLIDEYIGRVTSKTQGASVAHMRSPAGWEEPGQRPEFDEFTIVLKGMVRVKHERGSLDVSAGQAVIAQKGEWIQYSTPEGAEYIAVCVPAFSPETVHRDE
jgi:ethanolamine utilization protein EutQ